MNLKPTLLPSLLAVCPHSQPQHRPQATLLHGCSSRTPAGRDTERSRGVDTGLPREGDTRYSCEGARGTGPNWGVGAAHRIGAPGAPESGPFRSPSPLRCRHPAAVGGDAAPPCACRARRHPRVRVVPAVPPSPAPHRARLTFLSFIVTLTDLLGRAPPARRSSPHIT